MPNEVIDFNNLESAPRPLLPIIFVLDTSGSMAGAPISTLNHTMEEVVRILGDFAVSNADALIKIGVLQFDSNVKWMQPSGLEELGDFVYSKLETGGLTSMGAALTELDKKLSRKEYLQSTTGWCSPIIIFMTDGAPTDGWEAPLKTLIQGNKWFIHAIKIGFAVGDNAREDTLTQIVGNPEAVVKTNDLQLFSRLLSKVVLKSAMIGSKSHVSGDSADPAAIIKDAGAEIGVDNVDTAKGMVDPNYVPTPSTEPVSAPSNGGWGEEWK